MKKFFVLMMVAAMSIACASVEDKAKDYAEQQAKLAADILAAEMAGDEKKADELAKELDKVEAEAAEWYKGLSEEDKKVADEAAAKVIGEAVGAAAAGAAAAAAELL